MPNGHEAVTCGGIATTPCLFPQKEGDHPQQRMVKDTLSLRKGILSAAFPAKPPLKGEVPAVGGRRGSSPCAAKVAAAQSAVVTITKLIGDRIQRSGGTN